MSASWKIAARAPREAVEAAFAAHAAIDDWGNDLIVGASEVADHPQDWRLEAWLSRRPTRFDTLRLRKLFSGSAPEFTVERLPAADWVGHSQQQAEPIRAGPFRVRTPNFPPADEPGVVEFEIPAAQAFGTGQHETTAGCLEMLAAMKARGVHARNIADIGTGTGLLAFAALSLWPLARATASDIDPVCAAAVFDNAARNAVPLGNGRGELAFAVAPGLDAGLLQARAPYDLLIANILAALLIDLAPVFAEAADARGNVLLAGLLTRQEAAVRAAYMRAGFRLSARLIKREWSILWLRRRFDF